jgi:hypothetical protein
MSKKISYVFINSSIKQIIGTGQSNCQQTFNSLTSPEGFERIEFIGGVIGYYFVNGAMQEGIYMQTVND